VRERRRSGRREGGREVPVVLLLHACELHVNQRLLLGRKPLLDVLLHAPQEVGSNGGLEGGECGVIFYVSVGGLEARKVGKYLEREGGGEGGREGG